MIKNKLNPGIQYIDLNGLKITKAGVEIPHETALKFNTDKMIVLLNVIIERKSGQKEVRMLIPSMIDYTDGNSKLQLTFTAPGGGSNTYEVLSIVADPNGNTLKVEGTA